MSEIHGVDTRWAFTALVALVGVERLAELALSRRNVRRALARGAVEEGRDQYPWMVALHASFLAAGPLEVWSLGRPCIASLAAPMLSLVAGAMALRYWVILTLHGRWTTRVVYVPGDPLVKDGPFRWLRHPNYLAVVVEIAALPLVHTAWLTCLGYSVANAFALRQRIGTEEAALRRYAAPAEGGRA
jgi:methyltransferase